VTISRLRKLRASRFFDCSGCNLAAADFAGKEQSFLKLTIVSAAATDRFSAALHWIADSQCAICQPVVPFSMNDRNLMNEVDQLLLNARLRDEIEPFVDESLTLLETRRMPLELENEFLASMLAWEKAPVLPIRQWFDPELHLPSPETMSDEQLHQQLHQVIGRLYEKNIVLEFTDHLSDRELMCLIIRDILPAQEKQISHLDCVLHWQCIDEEIDEEAWLRYYATDGQRASWADDNQPLRLPPREALPYPRRLPGHNR
jgi:hypothetical protein